jgi:hypothetical protein
MRLNLLKCNLKINLTCSQAGKFTKVKAERGRAEVYVNTYYIQLYLCLMVCAKNENSLSFINKSMIDNFPIARFNIGAVH